MEKVSVPRAELDDLREKVKVYEKALHDAVADPTRRQELLVHAASPDSSSSTSPFTGAPVKTEPTDDNNVLSPGRLLQDADGMGRYLGETSGATFLDHLKELLGAALPLSQRDMRSPDGGGGFLSTLGSYMAPEAQTLTAQNVNPLWLPPDGTIGVVLTELRHFIQDGGGHWPSGGAYWWGELGSVPVRPPSLDVDVHAFRHLAFHHAALAMACQCTTTQPPPSSDLHQSLSEPYFVRAVALLGNPLDLQRRTIGDVASLAMMSFYLVETNRPDTAYMYVAAAMHISIMLGAHRGWVDERGKRIFWSVYCLDRWLSCLTGRPPTITDDAIQLPMPADDP